MKQVHRNRDARACGAANVVVGQQTVFANSKLVSVNADPNDHGAGNLIARCKEVYAGSKKVVIVTNHAAPDNLCIPYDGQHCDPIAAEGSPNVYAGEG